ncbi:MAG: class I SAM-dependent methyltransferase [Acidobacteriota bacterium]
MTPRIVLKANRAKSLEQRHPWVFSGAIDRVDGSPGLGATVDLVDADGRWLARGGFSPDSQIVARAWTFDPDEAIDTAFFRRRLARAIEGRQALIDGVERPACRLVHGESDGLPGLIVDRYADVTVVQCLAAGVERWRDVIVEALVDLTGCTTVYERSDVDVRAKEGLEPRVGLLHGPEPADTVMIDEGELRFLVDVRQGHKTGFYLDQRDSRARVASLTAGRRVLNAFSYTGAFTVAALVGGAESVVQIDSSGPALAMAGRQIDANGLDAERVESVDGNAFGELRRLRAEGRPFDLVLLDPPKFVGSKKQLERAARGYKDINLLACQLLAPGGLLCTWSCSGLLAPELFQKIVADAALDAGRFGQILHRLGASADHPTSLAFPQGSYLKGLVVRLE